MLSEDLLYEYLFESWLSDLLGEAITETGVTEWKLTPWTVKSTPRFLTQPPGREAASPTLTPG